MALHQIAQVPLAGQPDQRPGRLTPGYYLQSVPLDRVRRNTFPRSRRVFPRRR